MRQLAQVKLASAAIYLWKLKSSMSYNWLFCLYLFLLLFTSEQDFSTLLVGFQCIVTHHIYNPSPSLIWTRLSNSYFWWRENMQSEFVDAASCWVVLSCIRSLIEAFSKGMDRSLAFLDISGPCRRDIDKIVLPRVFSLCILLHF